MTTQPPAVEMPAPLSRALHVRNERARDHAEAQQAVHAARVAIETAVVEDRAAYAAARDEGKDDPGAVREREARDRIADCERREAGEAMRLARAEDDLAAAVAQHVDEWSAKLARVWAKADTAVLAAVAKLADAEAKRDEVRRVAPWLSAVQQTGDLDERVRPVSSETSVRDAGSSNAHLRVDDLLAALREHVEATSADVHEAGAPARIAARERDRRLAALRAHPDRQVQAAAALVDPAGVLLIEEAEAVAEGVPLDEVEKRAEQRRAEERPAPIGWLAASG